MQPKSVSTTIGPLRALGTEWLFEFFDTTVDIPLVTLHIENSMREFEEHYSRFLPHSEVSKLNRERILTDSSEEMCALLALAEKFYRDTDGVFNAGLGSVLEAHGYDASYSFTSNEQATTTVPVLPFTDCVQITNRTVTLRGIGNLDFGGFGKGFLIDKLALSLQKVFNLKYFVINGGGDIFVTSDYGTPITLYLEHPLEKNTYLYSIEIQNAALAASSPFKRRWKDQHNVIHTHLLDGTNAQRLISHAAFTVADTALMADTYATVASALGHDEIRCATIIGAQSVAYTIIDTDSKKILKSASFPTLTPLVQEKI